MENLPLQGIRVVDFGLILAIPHGTQWLSTMGAEVIKVESKSHPDLVRGGFGPQGAADGVPGLNRTGIWNSLHYGKKSCSINMTTEEGRELARQLIATADIVTENYTTPVKKRFGLTLDELSEVKSDIIILHQSSAGRSGPLSDTVGWGPTNQAYAGLPVLTGYEGGMPQSIGGTWPDYMIGVAVAFMLLSALHHRNRTGEGQAIDLSMCEMVTSMIPQAVFDFQMNGRLRGPTGNRDPMMAPHDVYRCAGNDTWIAITVETEDEWKAFCDVVGRSEWLEDERFADGYARQKHQDSLDGLITEWTRQYYPEEIMTKLQSAGIAAAPVLDSVQVLNNPQLRHRGFFITPDHPEVGPREVMGTPVLYSNIPDKRIGTAPLFDEHNDYVFGKILGLSPDEIESLVKSEIIF